MTTARPTARRRQPVQLTRGDVRLARVWAVVDIASHLPRVFGAAALVIVALFGLLLVSLVAAYWHAVTLVALGLLAGRVVVRLLGRYLAYRRDAAGIPF